MSMHEKGMRYIAMLSRSTGMQVPIYCFRYEGVNHETRELIFKIRMPITDEWETHLVDERVFHSNTISIKTSAKLDYWIFMKNLLNNGRDYSPMNRDLEPITPEEKSIFCASSKRYWKLPANYGIYDAFA